MRARCGFVLRADDDRHGDVIGLVELQQRGFLVIQLELEIDAKAVGRSDRKSDFGIIGRLQQEYFRLAAFFVHQDETLAVFEPGQAGRKIDDAVLTHFDSTEIRTLDLHEHSPLWMMVKR